MHVEIREEQAKDVDAIRELNERAFGQPQEARLVELLRANQALTLSLVATVEEKVVGHILFSPVRLESEGRVLAGVGLAPMSVLPEYQRLGIGSRLIKEGMRRLKAAGTPFIVVLGHPQYYPRFGFVPASRHGVQCEWDVPDEVFMISILEPSQFNNIVGIARYSEEFRMVI